MATTLNADTFMGKKRISQLFKHDRMQSFFKEHFQHIVFQKLKD